MHLHISSSIIFLQYIQLLQKFPQNACCKLPMHRFLFSAETSRVQGDGRGSVEVDRQQNCGDCVKAG